MSDRDTPFETPPVQTVDTVKVAQATQSVAREPGPDDFIFASLFVDAIGFICKRMGDPLSVEEKGEGKEKFARAIAANIPDTKAGPILLAVFAGVWAVGTLASRYVAYRQKKGGLQQPRKTNGSQQEPPT